MQRIKGPPPPTGGLPGPAALYAAELSTATSASMMALVRLIVPLLFMGSSFERMLLNVPDLFLTVK
jgi:hypothetical protein